MIVLDVVIIVNVASPGLCAGLVAPRPVAMFDIGTVFDLAHWRVAILNLVLDRVGVFFFASPLPDVGAVDAIPTYYLVTVKSTVNDVTVIASSVKQRALRKVSIDVRESAHLALG